MSAEDVYSGAASLGRIISWATAIVMSVIVAFLLIKAIMLKRRYPNVVTGNVISSFCQPYGKVFTCSIVVNYIVDGVSYIVEDTVIWPEALNIGDTITVGYNSPTDAKIEPETLRTWVVISAVVLAMVWFGVWLAQRYKFFAAAKGAGFGFNLFKKIF